MTCSSSAMRSSCARSGLAVVNTCGALRKNAARHSYSIESLICSLRAISATLRLPVNISSTNCAFCSGLNFRRTLLAMTTRSCIAAGIATSEHSRQCFDRSQLAQFLSNIDRCVKGAATAACRVAASVAALDSPVDFRYRLFKLTTVTALPARPDTFVHFPR
jgi:hypothetical protein